MEGKGKAGGLGAKMDSPLGYRLFKALFAALFFLVLALIIFANPGGFYAFRWYWLLAVSAAGVVVSMAAYLLLELAPRPGPRGEVLLVGALFGVLIGLQVWMGWMTLAYPAGGWGYGTVYRSAAALAETGALPSAHLAWQQGDVAAYTLLSALFSLLSLLGMGDFLLPALGVNILLIDLSILLLYLCARRLFGIKKALFLLVCTFGVLPFIQYAPILYTDTLALPFPIAMVLLWLGARACWRAGNAKGAMGRFCTISALAAMGAQFKFTTLALMAAIVLDLLLYLHGRGRWKLLLAGVGLCAVLFLLLFWGLRHSPLLAYDSAKDGLPLTGHLLMGMEADPAQAEAQREALAALPGPKARDAYARTEIGRQLSQWGVLGAVEHLGGKLAYVFGDGSYGAADLLDHNAARTHVVYQWVAWSGRYFPYYAYVAFGLLATLCFWVGFGSLCALARCNDALTFVRVAVFGLVAALLLWPSSPRSLVYFLPLLLLCAMETLPRPAPITRRGLGAAPAPASAHPPGYPLRPNGPPGGENTLFEVAHVAEWPP